MHEEQRTAMFEELESLLTDKRLSDSQYEAVFRTIELLKIRQREQKTASPAAGQEAGE